MPACGRSCATVVTMPVWAIAPLDGADAGGLRSGESLPSAAATSRAGSRVPSPRIATAPASSRVDALDHARRQQPQGRQRPRARRAAPGATPGSRRCSRAALLAEIAVVVMQEQRRIVVGDADFADRLGLAGDRRPYADAVEHQLRAIGDRRGAAVEACAEHRRRVLRGRRPRPAIPRRRRRCRAACPFSPPPATTSSTSSIIAAKHGRRAELKSSRRARARRAATSLPVGRYRPDRFASLATTYLTGIHCGGCETCRSTRSSTRCPTTRSRRCARCSTR